MTKNPKRKRGEAPLGIPTRPGLRVLIVTGQMGGIGKTTTADLVDAVADGTDSAAGAAITGNTGHPSARGGRSAR